ncbi:ATP/GTP-binding protein [Bermanella sp. R86510]|uniref:AAA family ATPase n=1 Tax=unclassified Bermanella TaxID=2627862 RepID=UPI0037C7A883
MIKNIVFSNFHSFASETLIDFALGQKPTPSGFDITTEQGRFNKAIAIVGANGSGKTQLLKPLAFLSWFVRDSFLKMDPEHDIPCAPHRLQESQSTKFELEFAMDSVDYRYQLEITAKEVIFEGLFEKTSSQYSYLFKREKTESGYTFKQKGFPLPKAQAERIRGNASIIAAAHNYDIAEARAFVEFFHRVTTNVHSGGRKHFQHGDMLQTAARLQKHPELRERLSQAMCQFDLGLSEVEIREITGRDENGREETLYLPFGKHTTDEGECFELAFFEESSGTQSAFVLLEPILETLDKGGIAIIDELDNDLHPHLIPHILEWFEYEHTNPQQAQLIFTCHTPEVLNLLQKHQVYLVEKHNQESEAWRLDDMAGLRADDNLYAKYMAGALGATPEL